MVRSEIRTHIRTLADELTEAPEGLFTDVELNSFINIVRLKVELDLIEYIPWYFRTKKDISFTISKDSYIISTDLLITDLFLFENIVKNESGKKATPLIYLEDPEMVNDYGEVGQTGEPRVFWREGSDNIGVWPNPDAAYLYRTWYFRRILALSGETDVPGIPECLHELLAFEVLQRWYIRDEASANFLKITTKYQEVMMRGVYELSAPQGLVYRKRPSAKEIVHRNALIYDKLINP